MVDPFGWGDQGVKVDEVTCVAEHEGSNFETMEYDDEAEEWTCPACGRTASVAVAYTDPAGDDGA